LSAIEIRIKPYPPNFKSNAAKIIEPATGASTCAFGSHKCTRKSGYLTINPATNAAEIQSLIIDGVLAKKNNFVRSVNLRRNQFVLKKIKETIKGREANTVYRNMLMPAENRSG
jgi:hypothetical protein